MTRLRAVPGSNARVAVGNVVVPGETVEMKLARAKGYPYPRPSTSFLFINSDKQGEGAEAGGEVFLFDNEQWRGQQGMPHIRGRCGTLAADFAAARGVDLAGLAAGQRMWPVLAIGSNAGPEQLRRKYPAAAFPGAVIPVIQIQLHGFDVVYTPYLASYGSCTATLEASPGTCVSIFITYLTEPLMERMHATEGGYNLTRLTGLDVAVAPYSGSSSGSSSSSNGGGAGGGTGGGGSHNNGEGSSSSNNGNSSSGNGLRSGDHAAGGSGSAAHAAGLESGRAGAGGSRGAFERIHAVYQYNHKLGCIDLPLVGGAECSPVAIAEIPAVGRVFPAATQPQMLAALREALGHGSSSSSSDGDAASALQPVDLEAAGLPKAQEGLDAWILRMVGDEGLRQAACDRLAGHARPFTYAQSEVMVTL
ncbi:hypothetical protein HXX76_012909 [Chlamydomonas incerta]|uniref:Uncharacterized protein n=1 Tax=Chlamydomonas incerta TaxID=51695 RepID=A0A835SG47_CHLIN|nr:hypothetical protein HXX76_012909 [Chlamydomonas incerta]|eukprot:KAG2426593.1 hypothetical protein HXX76_012909 [Chlamydomonas incerta]